MSVVVTLTAKTKSLRKVGSFVRGNARAYVGTYTHAGSIDVAFISSPSVSREANRAASYRRRREWTRSRRGDQISAEQTRRPELVAAVTLMKFIAWHVNPNPDVGVPPESRTINKYARPGLTGR